MHPFADLRHLHFEACLGEESTTQGGQDCVFCGPQGSGRVWFTNFRIKRFRKFGEFQVRFLIGSKRLQFIGAWVLGSWVQALVALRIPNHKP